ncbi:uncharacterized protein LOC104326596 isoform X4 [Opisthocomus hoazin]|uniref:uncharacterized protein LOC104326596 isoform X4 n=1 Tax=Opisthocomus hoazin TaxID=30419 RepID=UPI003F52ED78
MAQSLGQRLEAEATCPLCLELFSAPVVTECGHSFCGRCLRAVLGTPPRPAACPQCRAVVAPGSPRPNVSLRAVAELAAALAEEARRPLCPEHGEALGLFCQSCRCPLCPLCREGPPHRRHRVQPAAEAARELRETLQSNLGFLRKEREEFKPRGEEKSVSLLLRGSQGADPGAGFPGAAEDHREPLGDEPAGHGCHGQVQSEGDAGPGDGKPVPVPLEGLQNRVAGGVAAKPPRHPQEIHGQPQRPGLPGVHGREALLGAGGGRWGQLGRWGGRGVRPEEGLAQLGHGEDLGHAAGLGSPVHGAPHGPRPAGTEGRAPQNQGPPGLRSGPSDLLQRGEHDADPAVQGVLHRDGLPVLLALVARNLHPALCLTGSDASRSPAPAPLAS